MELKVIAKIHTDFKDKFGIPRQSGIAPAIGKIVFEDEYKNPDALKGIEGYSHLWLIWGFSENFGKTWSPTVRPPRLGGNRRMGVFATRSPFRPNSIGLSSVELMGIDDGGTSLVVKGADMVDGTPIYDIKPYLAYTDSHPDALGGFADRVMENRLTAEIPENMLEKIPENHRQSILTILENDPRPSYHNDERRVYAICYADMEIKFTVKENVLKVCDICDMH